ncbi:putative porin [Pseudocolwellia sp. HL-MZ7]|uniref:putative porin n=1 Tax=Pseudocolwellia sp. HL-MZ7 TaxID=3400627 RepID=UPI003CEFFF0E
MTKFYMFIVLCTLMTHNGQATEINASVLLRYENETNQINLTPRKRIRAIAAIGLTSQINENWSFSAQARTGLKNKQNVPAITLYQITDQAEGDKDIYLSRFYAKAQFDKVTLFVGKIPWKTQQVTDLFWDRDLNPIGIHVDYNIGSDQRFKFATFKPLDGASNTIGHMSILQYQKEIPTNLGQLTLSPWLVDYRGEDNATYAKKDTQFDNQFVRLSMALKQGKWQLGTDIGSSIKNIPTEFSDEFSNQKLSYTVELKYGGLKNVGSYLTQLKYLNVERFSVITEFAQNASSRFATSNFKAWDLRIRHKLTKKLWVGGRLSKTQRLIGTPEQSVRFRLETKYTF